MPKTYGALYPGQGSQAPGMGRFLYENFKVAKLLFEEASDLLSTDFKKLCFEGGDELNLTANTQPALLLVSTCTYRAFQEVAGTIPMCAAGHSIGEYAAVVSTGSLRFSDAIKAVRQRGEAMQSAVPVGKGAMMAVMGLTPEQTAKFCKWAESKSGRTPLEPANFNAPGQIVVSGDAQAVEWAQQNFTKDIFAGEEIGRAKFIPLKVSAPFHCSLMKPAEEVMRNVLSELHFADSQVPVVQNFTATAETKGEALRQNLIQQVSGAVRWIECMQSAKAMSVTEFVEFGNGKVLAGLAKKIDAEFTVHSTNSLEELKALEAHFH